ncbi:MAG: ATP-binding protein [Candidatus Promineifilaceae bacterium]
MLKEKDFSATIIAERLKRSEIFSSLDEEDLLAIAAFCFEETFDEGQAILVEGEPADRLFVVERGKLALDKKVQLGRHSTPRNATIDYVVPGRLAGFSAIAPPHIYSTSAICMEPTRVITIDGPTLRVYLHAHPAVGLAVMDTVAALIGGRYRQAIGTLTYFLSVVSHELRSPLAAIENYMQVMLGGYAGDLNAKQERMLKRSVVRVTDLRGQIGDIVDLARMRPEQIQSDFVWFNLGEVGTQAVEDVRLAAAEKDVRLKVEPPPTFEPIVGAPRRLRQVFTNLLTNAIRYSPAGSTVIFRAWYEPDKVYLQVEDEGPGIPEEDLPHIFKDFFRASNVEGEAGMGLGLSIAKKIVDAHDGEILVENLADETGRTGMSFTVILPRNLKTPEMRRQLWMESGDDPLRAAS